MLHRPRFRLSLPAMLVLVIALAACGPHQPQEGRQGMGLDKAPVGDTALVEVNGTIITQMDLEREAAAQGLVQPGGRLTPGSKEYERLLDELVDQRLLALQAVKEGLDKDREARTRLRLARERILGNVLVEQTINKAVTDEAVQKLYEEQAKLGDSGEEVHARHILVDTEEEAKEVRQALLNGASFATLAFERSRDASTRLEGGDLGFFTHDAMVGPVADAAFSLKKGEISQPVHSRYGWHIIEVEGRRKADQPTLAEVRPQIVRFMTFDEIQKLVTKLRDQADIERTDAKLVEKAKAAKADTAGDTDAASDANVDAATPDTQSPDAPPEDNAEPAPDTDPEPQPAPTPTPTPTEPGDE